MKVYESKVGNIYLGKQTLEFLFQYIIEEDYSSVFVLADNNTVKHCLPALGKHLIDYKLIQIEAGEGAKNLPNCERIWAALAAAHADRKSLLINLGGGTVTDIGGFCAATYKRGIDFIHVPTTLLGMVDASIGGKHGIDLNFFKNSVGVFRSPKAIVIYPDFLKTLDKRQLKAGMAEVTKHVLLDDREEWNQLRKAGIDDLDKLETIINRSVKFKRSIVNKDPFEQGLRKVLNLGHTIGHAIESWSLMHDKKPLLHGEAVAIGLLCEAYLSNKICGLDKTDLADISKFVLRSFPPYDLSKVDSEALLELMRNDKKNQEEQINFTLLKKVGKPAIDQHATDAQIKDALGYYHKQLA